jgi:tyrosinase
VHISGHFTIGGDAGADFFNSPSDPAFWFHHAIIDKVWWVWQNLDVEGRRGVEGPRAFLDMPPIGNGTLEDEMGLGYVGTGNITVGEAQSTIGGPFYYIYA